MFYTKNKSKTTHDAFANKFNHRKTIRDDNTRFKNTLLDFYLLANSNAIKSFTAYPHGSGFSYWSAKTYDIPYSCKYITV